MHFRRSASMGLAPSHNTILVLDPACIAAERRFLHSTFGFCDVSITPCNGIGIGSRMLARIIHSREGVSGLMAGRDVWMFVGRCVESDELGSFGQIGRELDIPGETENSKDAQHPPAWVVL